MWFALSVIAGLAVGGVIAWLLAEAKGDLGKKQEAINGLVRPLSESLKNARSGGTHREYWERPGKGQ
jgi:hypothetical protein